MFLENNSIKKFVEKFLAVILIVISFLNFTSILRAAAPTVITYPAINITKTSATLRAVITEDGGKIITDSGFELGLTTAYTQTVPGNEKYIATSSFGSLGSGDTEFNAPKGIDIDSSGNIYVADSGNNRVKKYDSSNTWLQNIDSVVPVDVSFSEPNDVTVLSDDSILVLDRTAGGSSAGGLLKFDSSGNFLDCYAMGVSCSQNIFFNGILRNISSGLTDNIYYDSGDGSNSQITGKDATFTSTIFNEAVGLGPNFLDSDMPSGLFVDSSSNVYFADSEFNRMQKLASDGSLLFKIGRSDKGSGGGPGEFSLPVDVTLDNDGNIFVVDSGNSRVQKFDSTGVFSSDFGESGASIGQLNSPYAIVADAFNDIYVVDTGNNRVQKFEKGFDNDLSVLLPSLTCGTLYHFRAFATNDDGTSYGSDDTFTTLPCDLPLVTTVGSSAVVADTVTLSGSHEDQGSLWITTRGFHYGPTTAYGSLVSEDGNLYVDEFGGTGGGGGNGTFVSLGFVGSDAEGNLYTTDQSENVIQKFSSNGDFISQYNVSPPSPGGITTPSVVRVAPDGKIYVVDYTNNQIVRFDTAFTNPTIFGAGAGISAPLDIAFDASGNAYVTDYSNNQVVKLDSSGNFLSTIGLGFGSGPGQLSGPSSVVLDSLGNIFVLDSTNNRIEKFDSSGVYLDEVGGPGSGDGQFGFSYLSFFTIDENDHLFVADLTNNRVQKFDSNFNFISKFGLSGTGHGEFTNPSSVAIGINGDIFVADGSNRIQKFNENFSLPVTGLLCGTTYHYEAFATNMDGTGDGADSTFVTDDCPPSGGGGGSSGTTFFCGDPLATNYSTRTDFVHMNNTLCNYPTTPVITTNILSCGEVLYLNRPIKYGANNNVDDVKLLEKYLNTYEAANITVDGYYSKTDFEKI